MLERLPSQAAASEANADVAAVTDRLTQLRARVRNDALHAALGDVLRLAEGADKK